MCGAAQSVLLSELHGGLHVLNPHRDQPRARRWQRGDVLISRVPAVRSIMPERAAVIDELWVYPIKACQGCRVSSARVTAEGFHNDRAWCIVDAEGVVAARCEAISQRKVRALATVKVSLRDDGSALLVSAPGMPVLVVPTAVDAYLSEPMIQVHSSSTTAKGEKWWLGETTCRQHSAGSAWFNEYLNRDAADPERPGMRISGGFGAATFALCRSLERGILLSSYPPVIPLTENAATDLRFAGSARRLADFAPFLLINSTSTEVVAKHANVDRYPTERFRANIVVRTPNAWDELAWKCVRAVPAAGGALGLALRKIKECPLCMVPCCDASTGRWAFPGDQLRLWKVLHNISPAKSNDADWGAWRAPSFGVYFGHGGVEGATICEGDRLYVEEYATWHARLRHTVGRCGMSIWVLMLAAGLLVGCTVAAPSFSPLEPLEPLV